MAQKLHELAEKAGQDVTRKVPFKDQSWLGTKTRSRDATLSRHSGINLNELHLEEKIATTPSGETWKGVWQGNEICAKFLSIGDASNPDVVRRASRSFSDEFPRLRIFSHPNVSPVLGCTNSPPNLVVITQYTRFGSLYRLLHESPNYTVDQGQALKFAIDIARGMAFLHTLDPLVPRLYLNSRHILVSNYCDFDMLLIHILRLTMILLLELIWLMLSSVSKNEIRCINQHGSLQKHFRRKPLRLMLKPLICGHLLCFYGSLLLVR